MTIEEAHILTPRWHRRSRSTSLRSGRRGGERGASLVEFAIIAPIFFALIFGIIEFGFAFNDYQSIRQGAREGARQAVVEDYDAAPTSCGGFTGTLDSASDNVKKVACLVRTRADISGSTVLSVRIDFGDDDVIAGDREGDPLKICAVRRIDTITGFLDPFIEGRPLKTEIEMRSEKKDIGIPDGVWADNDPTGDNWSWC